MKASNGNGKGDWPRPVNRPKYEQEYERLYGKQPLRNVWRPKMDEKYVELLVEIANELDSIWQTSKLPRHTVLKLRHIINRLDRVLLELRMDN
jgi:hypothetical protein